MLLTVTLPISFARPTRASLIPARTDHLEREVLQVTPAISQSPAGFATPCCMPLPLMPGERKQPGFSDILGALQG